ncbi:hypothetical protein [Nesterenkonia sp. F]|uniref:hypothetical protein n=1 Tax=Nesterenkonia sp. F TaxID=795955 RepID=UPI000255D387|nr:hypothetical protein [Nesterenkonia sp. F]
MSTDPRPGADSAPSRRRLVLAAALASTFALSSCSAVAEDGSSAGSRDPYAAVATESSDEGAGGPSASGGGEPAAARLDREDMQEVLLGEGEYPFTADEVVRRTGLEYFEESIGVTGQAYRRSFGEDDACARQMDTVNERLVGEDPVDGVYREATVTDDAGEHTLHVWMLAYDRPVSRGEVWDEVLAACDGKSLESRHDGVSFGALAEGPFRGLSMSIDDGGGESSAAPTGGTISSRVDGFSVTADLGHHVLSISSVGLSRESFDQALEVQRAALEEHPDLLG